MEASMRNFIRILSLFIALTAICYHQNAFAKEDWQRVYLATYPRSGNHWLRGLIEEATHIATSAVYIDKDPIHLAKPFPWGGYAADHGYEGNCRYPDSGEIIVIKTHYPAKPLNKFDLQPSVKIIRVVRHPIDTFHSHFLHHPNYKMPQDGKIPSWFVKKSIADWQKFETFWNSQENVFTVRYEDLLSDIHYYFREVLSAIGYRLSEKEINRAINKFTPHEGGLKHLNDYHPEDLKLISKKLGRLMKKYDYRLED